MNFESREPRRGTSETAGVADDRRRPRFEPDVRDDHAPAVEPSGRDGEPDLGAVEGHRHVRVTAAPAISPVEASTPDGRSTESTGSPLPRSDR